MVEALRRSETNLRSLTEFRIRTKALTEKANKATTTMELKRELRDIAFSAVNVRNEDDMATDVAWNGWHAAMAAIVRVGKVMKDHDAVMGESRVIVYAEAARSGAQNENEEIVDGWLEAVDSAQDVLRGVLKTLNNNKKAWIGWMRRQGRLLRLLDTRLWRQRKRRSAKEFMIDERD
ncbi:hypothetical protein K469DRAFT_694323 [Zopfia rhizophila CBS 207.26]|uniref:Uncharacterized protein n=1 Tax=Zopfia rhizophila CBS 207.26 TaxID=1314779 RepID=A0A6A6EQJ5_9PEZI|nr:hypothetical protein K469DRAFT_694323 [Zopfia rhizophila CBS 207.26]